MQFADAAAPATPPAGTVELYSRAQRLRGKSAAGREHDLFNVVETVYANGAERTQAARIEARTFTTGTGDFTLTFEQAYSAAPAVTVQAFATSTDGVTVAELVSVSTTQAVIRTHRTIVHFHPLGAARPATERIGATCHAIIVGVL